MTHTSKHQFGVFAFIAILLIVVISGSQFVSAADQPGTQLQQAERPWAAVWISSLANVLAKCDVIYDSIGRPDLTENLEERQSMFRSFRGIDRERPLGMMWGWGDVETPPAIMFFPVQELDELMKTVTLNGIVGYHKVKDGQYEIERPGVPYHAIIRSGYALLGEDVAVLDAMKNAPAAITKELKDKYDIVLVLDQRQVPKVSRKRWSDAIRTRVEPWLQPQDQEPADSAILRRAIGKSFLDTLEQGAVDVQTVTIGGRIDRKTYQLQVDVMLQAEQGTTMAASLNRFVVRKSEFSALVNREASAGLAINWPLTLLGKELIGLKGADPKNDRIDAGIQVIGHNWGDVTIIGGLRGAESTAVNAALPRVLTFLEQTKQVTSVTRNVTTYRDVALHKIVPTKVPDLFREYLHPRFEILVGQGKDTTWFAAGDPETLTARFQAAVDAVAEGSTEKVGSVMQGRLSVGKWPKVVPIIDPEDTKEALLSAKDGFTLSVLPIPNGLKVQFAAEEGLLRVIATHWARQVDAMPAPAAQPPASPK